MEKNVPRILARPEHNLSRDDISTNAVKVLYRLHRAGYIAYLVGGGVRDILLGGKPKDFDVATNARPQEIRRLFRNSRIIGRRFRLAHILFRDEIVEVSTFRASPEPPEEPPQWEEEQNESGEEGADTDAVIESNDVYGTPEEDARRRDLTINALFYNIADYSIIDLVGGIDDLEHRVIRTIGEPEDRFNEDPVRMMRALEYSVRLGFTVEAETEAAIHNCAEVITEASPARLSYELLEGLQSGHAAGIIEAWHRAGILYRAFPDLEGSHDEVVEVLRHVDAKLELGAKLQTASFFGALFLPRFMEILREIDSREGRFDNAEMLARLKDALDPAGGHMHLSNLTVHLVHHGLFAMTKMRRAPERGRQVLKLVRQDYFSVAWDLFSIATSVGYFDREAARAWSRAIDKVRRNGDRVEPEAIVDEGRGARGRSRSRRRRRPRRRRKS